MDEGWEVRTESLAGRGAELSEREPGLSELVSRKNPQASRIAKDGNARHPCRSQRNSRCPGCGLDQVEELFQPVGLNHAVSLEDGAVQPIVSRERTGVGCCGTRGVLCASNLQHHDPLACRTRTPQCPRQFAPVPCAFKVGPDYGNRGIVRVMRNDIGNLDSGFIADTYELSNSQLPLDLFDDRKAEEHA